MSPKDIRGEKRKKDSELVAEMKVGGKRMGERWQGWPEIQLYVQ